MGNIFQWTNGVFTGYVGLHWNGTIWSTNINGSIPEVNHVANDVTGDDFFMVSVGNWSINPPLPALGEFDNRTKKWKGIQFQTHGELRSVWTDKKGFFIAVGDTGMVYTKDGYSASWVHFQLPTNFSLYKVTGISKTEIFTLGYLDFGGTIYPQLWKYNGIEWTKLMDDLDTTGTAIQLPAAEHTITDLAVSRCSVTDTFRLYLVGWESYILSAGGNSTDFSKSNMTTLGLPLRTMGRTATDIDFFSPNDFWVMGTRYNTFHWNGNNFENTTISGLPVQSPTSGDMRRMVKTASGKIFFPTEVSSQEYIVVQGIP